MKRKKNKRVKLSVFERTLIRNSLSIRAIQLGQINPRGKEIEQARIELLRIRDRMPG